ncbi:hypothetical protein VE01_09497 [Pseudogymnoascus verrucosus]|uniref:INO80 complex subunit B-like conserved region domain-containing protein n=1 Tax=Pseudogymnoascus verrucosus TaxID=342668 RepID=A0A1B8G8V6_9PEZI|nr:uncharacterized protein VE01_09497 [Pseudogymnoascus verrucosus]OBT92257.2 hypothetical protein VE01_09497 [Pseudogymnoascus verrucosus]
MSRVRRDPDTHSSSHSRATLSRNDPPSSPSNPSLRLTVKMPVSKLRAATGGASSRASGGRSSSGGGRGFVGETRESTRARGVKKSYVVESESEEEDEEMEDLGDEEEEEDAEGEEEDDMDLDEDAEGEEDGDDDTEMAGLPPPTLKIAKPTKEKHSITVKTAGKKDVRVVATTEPSDDEELSDLESEVEEDEETMQVGNDEDAEGEDEEIEVEVEEEEEEEEEDELDSDEEGGGGSRGSTPDLSKLTKRQRARLDESGSGHLMALPDEVQVKKHLTAEEHAMRRAEMARRRKNLSEKRNEEEKMETINKLLKKQAPKTNARRRDLNGLTGEIGPDGEPGKPNSAYVRWISSKEGNRICVPTEMVEGPLGGVFGGGRGVEEVV